MPTALSVQLTATCPRCHQPLHVQGLTEVALCPACQGALELPVERWLAVLSTGDVLEALESPLGSVRSCTMMGALDCKYALGHQAPACASCGAAAPLADLDALARGWTCACGAAMSAREADDLARAVVPGARLVLGEGALAASTDEGRTGAAPVHFGCMACGGSLTVDGSTRAVTCPFCGGSNYLPDGLWLRLHPPSTVRTWYVVVAEGGSDLSPELLDRLVQAEDYELRVRAARSRLTPAQVAVLVDDDDADVRRALARNTTIGPAALAQLAEDDDDDVRKAVLKNEATTDAIVDKLAGDDDYGVRRAAMRTGRVSEAALLRLAADERDSDVLKALGKQSLSPAVLAALARNAYYGARQVAAGNPELPEAQQVALAADDDSDVLRALSGNPGLTSAAVLALAARDDSFGEQAQTHPLFLAARRQRLVRRLIAAGVGLVLLGCVGGGAGLLGVLGFGARFWLRHR